MFTLMVIVHLLLVAAALKWYADRDKVWVLLLIGLFAPLISWPVLGYQAAVLARDFVQDRHSTKHAEQASRRAEAVTFLRHQLQSGTPVEQENARQILAMWQVPEVEPPADDVAPAVIRTSKPEQVRQVGPWLVVGGIARAHVEPPSLDLYARGCRCPACRSLIRNMEDAREANRRRATNGFAQAVEAVRRQMQVSTPVPPELLVRPEDCMGCDQVEVYQRNAAGQIVVVQRLVERPCPAHREAEDWEYWNGW